MIDFSKLRSALDHLEAQWKNLQSLPERPEITPLDTEAVEESVIKRFDLALEMSWKLAKRYLGEVVGLSDLPNGPKPILRLADQNNLLGGHIESWITYINARNNSSHDDSREKARETLALVADFLRDANHLYREMEKSS